MPPPPLGGIGLTQGSVPCKMVMCEYTTYYNQTLPKCGQPHLGSGSKWRRPAFCASRLGGRGPGVKPRRRFFSPFSFAVERKGAGFGGGTPNSRSLGATPYLQKSLPLVRDRLFCLCHSQIAYKAASAARSGQCFAQIIPPYLSETYKVKNKYLTVLVYGV